MTKNRTLGTFGAVLLTGVFASSAYAASWPDRAEAALTDWLRGPSGVSVAQSIQRIAHPTGSDANLTDVDVRHVGDALSVRLTVSWSGGFGGAHTTVVAWDFDRHGHRSAAVLRDDAMASVSEKNARKLDTYFRDSVYPNLRTAVGN